LQRTRQLSGASAWGKEEELKDPARNLAKSAVVFSAVPFVRFSAYAHEKNRADV
jgi:hypothetical protein